jgi:hypothetical protein
MRGKIVNGGCKKLCNKSCKIGVRQAKTGGKPGLKNGRFAAASKGYYFITFVFWGANGKPNCSRHGAASPKGAYQGGLRQAK